MKYVILSRNSYQPISILDFSLAKRSGKVSDFVNLPEPVSEFLADHEMQVLDFVADNTTQCTKEEEELMEVNYDDEELEDHVRRRKKTARRVMQPAGQSLTSLVNTARLICNASFKALLFEVICLEQILGILPVADLRRCHSLRPVPESVDLALASHFDYSLDI